MKYRILRLRLIGSRIGAMNINGVKTFVSFEKFIPQRRQHHRTSSQKHKGNLRDSLERVISNFRNHRCSPNQLFIGHIVHQFRWVQVASQSNFRRRRGCLWCGYNVGRDGRVGGGGEGKLCELEIEGDVFEMESENDTET